MTENLESIDFLNYKLRGREGVLRIRMLCMSSEMFAIVKDP